MVTRCDAKSLLSAGAANGGDTLLVLDGTAGGAASLNRLDDTLGLGVSDLAEDDVAAIEPRSDDGGDEELGAVAGEKCQCSCF